jgi:hypothetical protein
MPFLALLKAPGVIIGILAFLAGASAATWTTLKIKNGEIAALKLGYEREVARQEAEANRLIQENQTALLAKEREYSAYKDEVEKKDAEDQSRIHGMAIANGRLIAAAGGLFDRNGRPTGQGGSAGVPGDSAAAASGDAPGSGCQLSEQASLDLLALAVDADLVGATTRACQADAVNVRATYNKKKTESE